MVALAIFVAALAFGLSDAHFKCNRNIHNSTHKNEILELGKLLSLESLCMDVCQQTNCSLLDGAGGILGGLGGVLGGSGGGPLGAVGGVGSGLLRRRRCATGECTAEPATTTQASTGGSGGCSGGNGPCSQGGSGSSGNALDQVLGGAACLLPGNTNPNKVSPYQACLFPCILDLNVLNVCDVQAIITKVVKICPKADLKGVCVSACLCCSADEGETVDTCVNLCLSNHGIDLNLSPLKLLGGSTAEDSIKAPTIDGFQLPGLPLLPQLGLGSTGSAITGSSNGNTVSAGSSSGISGGSSGSGSSSSGSAGASGSGSASAGGSGSGSSGSSASSNSSASASASASSSSNATDGRK
jgi:hypothetical protein